MELAAGNVPVACEVTYDSPDLFVGMSVYDVTNLGVPILLSQILMTNVVGNTYVSGFIPLAGRSYLVFKAVYTSSALITFDGLHSQASETIVGYDFGQAPGPGIVSVIGYVDCNGPIVGPVNC